MTEQEKQALLQKAVDSRLSGLRADPFLAQMIMNHEQGEIKMKKKRTASLILALSLALICVFALAEGRHTASNETQSSPLPPALTPLQTQDPMADLPRSTIDYVAVVPIYVPVTLHFDDEAQTQVTLDHAVAELHYAYRIYYEGDSSIGYKVGEPSVTVVMPDPDFLLAEHALNGIASFQAPKGASFSSKQGGYTLILDGEMFNVSYFRDIYVDQHGQIIDAKEATIGVPVYLADESGTLLDQSGQPLEGAILTQTVSDLLPIAPSPVPSMAPSIPAAVDSDPSPAAPTSVPLNPAPPLPAADGDAAQSAREVTAITPRSVYTELTGETSYQYRVILPVAVKEHVATAERGWVRFEENAFSVFLNTEAFTASEAFAHRETQPAFSPDWIDITRRNDAYSASYTMTPPQVTVEYGDDSYTVHMTAAHLQFTYSETVYYSDEAISTSDDGQQIITFRPSYKVEEEMVTRLIPINWQFTLPYPEAE